MALTFKTYLRETSPGAGEHGEYKNDTFEKTMVHRIITLMLRNRRTAENYEIAYSFIESPEAEQLYDQYYDMFKQKDPRFEGPLDVRKWRRFSTAVKKAWVKWLHNTKLRNKMKVNELVNEGDVVKAKFGKSRGPERHAGIEVPKGYDRFEVDGKKIIGIKGNKRVVVSSTSDVALARELVKAHNNDGMSDIDLTPISMTQAFGSRELAALDYAGIKITEKPQYWEDFEGDGWAAEKNIHEVKLKKIEKLIGKLKVYTGKELFGTSNKPKGPLVSVTKMPEESMFIVHFTDDDSKYLADTTGASTYIRNWQKIE